MPELSILIPTLGRPGRLARVLDRLGAQTAAANSFEVIVVADAKEPGLQALDRVVENRPYRVRRLQAGRPGASAARNVAWRASTTSVVLFLDDDVLPARELVAEHAEWHRRYPEPEIGVLGHVRWADELHVTPFMRWLEHGIQYDYPNIDGIEAGWGRFNTSNASVKRALLAQVDGFAEEAIPFLYEDTELALRMHEHGFRLLYNRSALAEHLHRMDLESWQRRVAHIAVAERQFIRLHPEVRPYFFDLFTHAMAACPARGRGERLARFVPRSVPVLGPRIWGSADAVYRQALAEPFLAAWVADAEKDEPR